MVLTSACFCTENGLITLSNSNEQNVKGITNYISECCFSYVERSDTKKSIFDKNGLRHVLALTPLIRSTLKESKLLPHIVCCNLYAWTNLVKWERLDVFIFVRINHSLKRTRVFEFNSLPPWL